MDQLEHINLLLETAESDAKKDEDNSNIKTDTKKKDKDSKKMTIEYF